MGLYYIIGLRRQLHTHKQNFKYSVLQSTVWQKIFKLKKKCSRLKMCLWKKWIKQNWNAFFLGDSIIIYSKHVEVSCDSQEGKYSSFQSIFEHRNPSHEHQHS